MARFKRLLLVSFFIVAAAAACERAFGLANEHQFSFLLLLLLLRLIIPSLENHFSPTAARVCVCVCMCICWPHDHDRTHTKKKRRNGNSVQSRVRGERNFLRIPFAASPLSCSPSFESPVLIKLMIAATAAAVPWRRWRPINKMWRPSLSLYFLNSQSMWNGDKF